MNRQEEGEDSGKGKEDIKRYLRHRSAVAWVVALLRCVSRLHRLLGCSLAETVSSINSTRTEGNENERYIMPP
jgi:hypothetical protein